MITLKPNALATIEDIKRMDKDMSSNVDDEIAALINHFSKMAEGRKYCNRLLEKKLYTEIYDGRQRCNFIIVKAPPIIQDASLEVWDDNSLLFTDVQYRLVVLTDYVVYPERGMIKLRGAADKWNNDLRNVQIKYNGGLVSNSEMTGEIDIPDDLRDACITQVRFWWKNRDNQGIIATSIQNVQTQYMPNRLLPAVIDTLQSYVHFD